MGVVDAYFVHPCADFGDAVDGIDVAPAGGVEEGKLVGVLLRVAGEAYEIDVEYYVVAVETCDVEVVENMGLVGGMTLARDEADETDGTATPVVLDPAFEIDTYLYVLITLDSNSGQEPHHEKAFLPYDT